MKKIFLLFEADKIAFDVTYFLNLKATTGYRSISGPNAK